MLPWSGSTLSFKIVYDLLRKVLVYVILFVLFHLVSQSDLKLKNVFPPAPMI